MGEVFGQLRRSTVSLENRKLNLIGWLLICFSASATAVFVSTHGWYVQIHKPSWNPPSWLFGPVWSTLYAMMAIAAWLVYREGGFKTQARPLYLFLTQLALNALWTPLFFGLHLLGIAFIEIIILWGFILMTIISFWKVKPVSALLLIPYIVWVSFAATLSGTIWWLNH